MSKEKLNIIRYRIQIHLKGELLPITIIEAYENPEWAPNSTESHVRCTIENFGKNGLWSDYTFYPPHKIIKIQYEKL